jgi:hypothetical protein
VGQGTVSDGGDAAVTTNYQKHQQSLRIVEQILDIQETIERDTRPWIQEAYRKRLKELRAQLDAVDRSMRSSGVSTKLKRTRGKQQ